VVSANLVYLFLIRTHPAATKRIRSKFIQPHWQEVDLFAGGLSAEEPVLPDKWLTAGRGGGQG